MRWLGLVLLGLCACSSSSSLSAPPTLVGNWIQQNASGTVGLAADFKSDGTYVMENILITSSTSANVQVETGTWTAANGKLTQTPQQWSCVGADPPETNGYAFSGSDLLVTTPTGQIELTPNTSNGMTSMGFTTVNGCFNTQTGAFTQHALGPVN